MKIFGSLFCFSCAIAYFKRSRTCFERIIELNGDPLEMIKSETSKERVAIWRDVAVTAHNLLKFNAKVFSEIWNWSPFYALLHHPDHVVRYHTAESIALILGMNDAAKTEFFQTTLGMTVDFLVSARSLSLSLFPLLQFHRPFNFKQ